MGFVVVSEQYYNEAIVDFIEYIKRDTKLFSSLLGFVEDINCGHERPIAVFQNNPDVKLWIINDHEDILDYIKRKEEIGDDNYEMAQKVVKDYLFQKELNEVLK